MKILPLAIDALNGAAQSKVAGLTTTAKFFAVVGVLAAISAVFFLVGITVLLAEEIGAVYACLTMSAVFAVAALFVVIRHKRARRHRRIVKAVDRAALTAKADTAAGAGAIVLAEAFIKGFFRRRP